jgi:hypothetical protein
MKGSFLTLLYLGGSHFPYALSRKSRVKIGFSEALFCQLLWIPRGPAFSSTKQIKILPLRSAALWPRMLFSNILLYCFSAEQFLLKIKENSGFWSKIY